jgi:hypothetical protein
MRIYWEARGVHVKKLGATALETWLSHRKSIPAKNVEYDRSQNCSIINLKIPLVSLYSRKYLKKVDTNPSQS